ncbi:MAG TPA: AlpA family phage regulatory protein [Bradyrhizobium sp.]|jgi:prophage regulatory protein
MTETTPRKMLTEKQVLALVPVARSTIWNWVRNGTFPNPKKIGPSRVVWYADEIAAWQSTKDDAETAA